MKVSTLVAIGAASVCFVVSARLEAQVEIRPLLQTGDTVPVLNGVRVEEVSWPGGFSDDCTLAATIRASGAGITSGNDQLTLLVRSSHATLLAQEGQLAPDLAGFRINESFAQLGSGGNLALTATLHDATGAGAGYAYYYRDSSELRLVLKGGDALPGVTANTQDASNISDPGRSGHLLLQTWFPGAHPWSEFRTALHRWSPTLGHQLVMRSGDSAPGVVGGGTFSTTSFTVFPRSSIQVEPDGSFMFSASVNRSVDFPASGSALYRYDDSGLVAIAAPGQPTPEFLGLGGGYGVYHRAGNAVELKDGRLLFHAAFGSPMQLTPATGLLATDLKQAEWLYRYSTGLIPNSPTILSGFGALMRRTTATDELVAFAGIGSLHSSTFALTSGHYTDLKARVYQGLPTPITGLAFGAYDYNIGQPSANASGRSVFHWSVAGEGVTSNSDDAIWTMDIAGNLSLIAREGDLFHIGEGEFKTIADFGLAGAPMINDTGLIAFFVRFTDGSAGIFSASVPEPTLAALIAAGFALSRRQRR